MEEREAALRMENKILTVDAQADEQLMAGKTPELCECPQEMPFKIDPNCETGTGAVWVEPAKMLSLGHETFYLQLTALPKSCKNAAVSTDFAKQVRGPISLSLSLSLACLTSRISAAPRFTRARLARCAG